MFGKQKNNTCEEEMISNGSNSKLSLTIKENRLNIIPATSI